jgi:hypothetical protein
MAPGSSIVKPVDRPYQLALTRIRYLTRLEEPNSTSASIKRARIKWETLDARRRGLAGRMGEIEDAEGPMMA